MTNPITRFISRKLEPVRQARFNTALANWLAQSRVPQLDLSGQRVLFNTVRANLSNVHLVSDLYLGRLLAMNGAQVQVLLDDGILEHWDSIQRFRSETDVLNPMRERRFRARTKRAAESLARVFATPGLHLVWYSELIGDAGPDSPEESDQAFARASTVRHFENGVFDGDDPAQAAYYQLSLRNAALSHTLARLAAERFEPDLYATSHGIYSTWGPAYRWMRDAGIATQVYAQHPYRLKGLLINDAPGGIFQRDAMEQFLESATLRPEQAEHMREYLNSRVVHTISDTREYFDQEGAGDTVRSGNRQEGVFTFGMFPNVVWDAVGDHLNPLYENVIDWIVDTVQHLRGRTDCRLIIRFHPSEATRFKGTMPTHQLVEQAFPELGRIPNVELILPDNGVDSYELIRNEIDLTLVFTGTLGAEPQMLGVPVVAVAEGRFSHQFVSMPASIEAYREILANPQPVVDDFRQRRQEITDMLLKYHWYVNEEMFYPQPMLSRHTRRVLGREEFLETDGLMDMDMTRTLEKLSLSRGS